jgi:hypothetical protein
MFTFIFPTLVELVQQIGSAMKREKKAKEEVSTPYEK